MSISRKLASVSLALLLSACSPGAGETTGETGGGGEATAGAGGGGGAGTSTSTNGDGGGAGGTDTGGAGGSAGGGAGGGAGNDWGPDKCPSPPEGVTVGIEVGQQLPEFTVKDCDGNDFSLSELCGAEGLFLFAAHGWCPLCQSVSSKAEAIHDSFAGEGLASAIVLVQTGSSQPPTASYCQLWRDQFGLEDVLTLYDPTGSILQLWPGMSSSLSAYVDRDRVIVSKLQYDSNAETIKARIQEALDH